MRLCPGEAEQLCQREPPGPGGGRPRGWRRQRAAAARGAGVRRGVTRRQRAAWRGPEVRRAGRRGYGDAPGHLAAAAEASGPGRVDRRAARVSTQLGAGGRSGRVAAAGAQVAGSGPPRPQLPIELPPAEPPRTRPPPGSLRAGREPAARAAAQLRWAQAAAARWPSVFASAATGGSGLPGAADREAPPPDPPRGPVVSVPRPLGRSMTVSISVPESCFVRRKDDWRDEPSVLRSKACSLRSRKAL